MGLLFKTLERQRLRYKGFFVFFLIMTLIVSVASVLMTRYTGEMGQATIDMDMNQLLQFLIIISIIMLIRAITSAASALFLGRFAGKAGYRFRDNFVKHFLEKPFSAFSATKSGQSLSIYSNDLPAAVELVSNGGIRMIGDIITLAVTLAYMIYLNWWLALIFFGSFPVLIIVQVLIAGPIQKQNENILEKQANINAVANDSFQNTSTVIAYTLEEVMEKRCGAVFEEYIAANKKVARSLSFLILAGIIASMSPLLIVIAVSAYQVIYGDMNIAQWIAFISLASEAGSWLMMLSQRLGSVQTSSAGANRMNQHIEGEPENIHEGNTLSSGGDIAISAVNIKFAYDTQQESYESVEQDETATPNGSTTSEKSTEPDKSEEPGELEESATPTEPIVVLDDVSFDIKKGDRVAFVGGSGSGKSTILKLLLGLYTPQEGKLSVMGKDTKDISLHSLRNTFAYVPQDSHLFPETIVENITGESEITDRAKLEKACSDAGILEFIKSLPEGFNATLGESAENVSGGQKQRIALARAFYRDAPIILFDEATSALDPATEAAVLESFNTLSKDKTVLMVAHRFKAIDFCDYIIVMENGKVAAIGTHEELLSTSPAYKSLYQAQEEEVSA